MTLKDATPVLPVSDIGHAVAFFRDVLGFDVGHRFPGYAYLYRDRATIRLIQAADGANMHDPARQQAVYIDTGQVDGVFDDLRPKLETLPEGHVRPPFDQPYGQREFHIYYEAVQIIFGAAISQEARP